MKTEYCSLMSMCVPVHTLTVHIHSQSEGVRPCNIACCNLVHSTVITSDVSNSQTSSSDSEPCVIDWYTILASTVFVGGGLVSIEKENVNDCPSVGVAVA